MNLRPGFDRFKTEWWLVALSMTALVACLVAGRATVQLDNLAYDALLRLNQRAPSPDILLVTIDNRSLREVGPWPWPRERHARLLAILKQAEPRAIAYDILFVEPGSPDGDHLLGQAVAGAPPVFVPLLLDIPGTNGAHFDAIEPILPVRDAAAGIGHVNLMFDTDGLVRRVHLRVGDEHRQWRHLMTLVRDRVLSGGSGADERTAVASAALDGLVGREPVMISYAGPPGRFPAISAASVLRGEVPVEFLRNRLILVGATADGLGDQYPTPLGNRNGVMPGIEIQANLLNTLLTGHLIRPIEGWGLYAFSLLPLWLLLLAFRRLRPRATIFLLTGLLVAIGAAIGALLLLGLWLPPASALIGLALVYPLWGWRRLAAVSAYMTSELERLHSEPDLLPRDRLIPDATDIVGRQALLLHAAITRVRDMRRFVSDRLHQMPDSTLVTDCEGRILLANAEAERLFDSLGLAPQRRTHINDLLALLRPLHEMGLATIPFAPGAGGDTGYRGGEVRSSDGRFFNLRFEPQHSSDDRIVGWVARVADISDAKAAEQQREDILQLLTHDMRSPQTSIITVIDNTGSAQIDDDVARRIKGYAQRTLALADGFVQLARAQLLDYVLEDVNLPDILIDAIDDLWPQSSARNIKIDMHGAEEDLFVRGERSLLTRMLINLIGNAIKYSAEGSRIECSLARGEGAEAGLAICTISDSGIGMAPEHLARLFERFHRASSRFGGGVEGVGLGLAFVHTVVIRHEGMIRCESRLEQGTSFTIELPLTD